MQAENPVREDSTLAAVRRRSQGYLGSLLWVFFVLCVLWTLNTTASLVERWVTMLYGVRHAAGLAAPVSGPDYWILGGVAGLALLGVIVFVAAYGAYRVAWQKRLRGVWSELPESSHLRIRPLTARANDAELHRRAAYLTALASCSEWRGIDLEKGLDGSDARQAYTNASAAFLRSLEADIAQRAVTAGLVIGLSRNPLIDSLTIAASAFELQLHVLTRLGKRPSPRTWIELLKRTGASLFLNSYVSREDTLYLNLAIRKAALGIEMASDSMQQAAGSLADVDWDEVLHGVSVPGLHAMTSVASMSMTVGAFGLRHIGSFVETSANDLLQGVLAGGILYYHGMAVAAECLALDEEHRRSPEMTRTIGQAMAVSCAPAGRLLRDQVRRMREFLRERRRLAFDAAKDAAKQGVGKLRSASSSKWARVKEATGFSRESP